MSDRLNPASAAANGKRGSAVGLISNTKGTQDEAKRPQSAQRQDRWCHQRSTTAHVRIDIGGGVIVTSSITNEAVDDLALKTGDDAFAVIKASDVMVAK
jgi:molybdopterin-binding protein